ncbi:hypothetical protein BC831DRAFT_385549, partial [Entophlyctis helioformis]
GVFPCTFDGCNRKFTRKYNLEAHLRSHLDERPYVCTLCPASFSRQHDLKRHTSSVHERQRKYGPCAHCRSVFLRSDAYKRH